MICLTVEELKDKLTEDDIKKLLEIMGATFYFENEDYWITNTICHGGNKAKLYFYKNSQIFNCYTECGAMDIVELVIHYKDYSDDEWYIAANKAINWIRIKLNIDNFEFGFGLKPDKPLKDWSFINSIKQKRNHSLFSWDNSLSEYKSNILNCFQNKYFQGWIDEGISPQSMKKYNIGYCTWQQKIIIPHYDINNRLIGIRGRALLNDEIELYGKYSPLRISNYQFNHPLGQNLYGLNYNLNAIKDKRKIMLVEGEKSVLQADTMFGEQNFTVALCGKNLSLWQRKMIVSLGVREVIIALDKQFKTLESKEAKDWAKHISQNIITPLAPYTICTVLWDSNDLLPYKASPTDCGKETLLKLMDGKIYVETFG